MQTGIVLRLYVTGQTARSRRAIRNVARACREAGEFVQRLSIVDVLNHPEMAEQARILATPTLVIEQPSSNQRLIGDLSEAANVRDWLCAQIAESGCHP